VRTNIAIKFFKINNKIEQNIRNEISFKMLEMNQRTKVQERSEQRKNSICTKQNNLYTKCTTTNQANK
jgi:hypothetical protein